MEQMKKIGTVTGAMLLALLLSFAALPAEAAEKIVVDEIVVTATRYGEKLTDVPAYVTVISEDDIKAATAHSIPDLLKTTAGIHINDITGNRRTFTVDLRGFGETASSNTLVLVDGRRINQADLSGVDWMDIPLERVKRIEVIRGGRGSVLYGDNATGGVINIITKEGEGFKGGFDLAAGSYSTFRTGVHAGGSSKNASVHVSGNYLSSDGYRDNSQTNARDGGITASYYIKDFMRIQFSGGYHKDKTSLPGALKESDFAAGRSRTDTIFPNDFVKTEDYYLKLTPEVYFGSDSTFRIDSSFRKRTFLSFSSGDWGNFLGDSEIKTVAVSPQIVFKKAFGPVRNSLTAGFDYQKNDNDIVNDSLFFGFRSLGNFNLKKEAHGYYLHDEVGVTDNLRISGGYRYNKAEFSFDPSSPDSISMSRDTYTAGLNYTFSKKSFAYLSYSRSFRYPLLDELYSFVTNSINPSLDPQTSDTYEAGVRYYLTDRLYAHLNVFRLDTEKEIFFNPLTFTNENLDGKSRRDGIETSVSAQATDWLTLRGTYTYLKAKVREGSFRGKDVPNVPEHKASLEATASLGKGFTAGLNGIYIGKRPFISDLQNSFSMQKGYAVLNAKFGYQWKAIKAFLDINNLLNKEYTEYGVIGGFPAEKAFYPSPKRNILAGLTLTF